MSPSDVPGSLVPTTNPLREQYPTLFYHTVDDPITMEHMGDLRLLYLDLAACILAVCPPNRSRSLAMTELEYSLMRAIQSLAVTGHLEDPRPQTPAGGA